MSDWGERNFTDLSPMFFLFVPFSILFFEIFFRFGVFERLFFRVSFLNRLWLVYNPCHCKNWLATNMMMARYIRWISPVLLDKRCCLSNGWTCRPVIKLIGFQRCILRAWNLLVLCYLGLDNRLNWPTFTGTVLGILVIECHSACLCRTFPALPSEDYF